MGTHVYFGLGLIKLFFWLLKVTSDSIQAIGTLQKLEVLAMAGCGLVDDNGLRFLGHGCPSLQV